MRTKATTLAVAAFAGLALVAAARRRRRRSSNRRRAQPAPPPGLLAWPAAWDTCR